MITLKEGKKAPDFELEDQEGKKARLSDFKGNNVVLYFYPKDDTPGCTREACAIRDNIVQLNKANAVVLGVSNDDADSHKKFVEKYALNFRLLADVDKKVSKAYGVYELKNNFGKEYYGITRSTFVIDGEGKIKKIFYKVNPDENLDKAMQVLKD
jgi:thioredoxin-dependent peroxiredoxin